MGLDVGWDADALENVEVEVVVVPRAHPEAQTLQTPQMSHQCPQHPPESLPLRDLQKALVEEEGT